MDIKYPKQKKLLATAIENYDIDSNDTTFIPYMDKRKYGCYCVSGYFKVISITKKKNNYVSHEGHLRKKTIFIISVCDTVARQCQSIISINEKCKSGVKLKKGEFYYLELYQINGEFQNSFTSNRIGHNMRQSLMYKNILLCLIESKVYFESPCIVGIRYCPNPQSFLKPNKSRILSR